MHTHIKGANNSRPNLALFLLLGALLAACDGKGPVYPPIPTAGGFTLSADHDSIRSYPGGGGAFLVLIHRDSAFSGLIRLRVECAPQLNAVLSNRTPARVHETVELLLAPDADILPDQYSLTVVAEHGDSITRLPLRVTVFPWLNDIGKDALVKRDEFREHLLGISAGYGEIFSTPQRLYATYPMTLIVEHFTEFTPQYECRWCYHVMVPPHDWSMLRVRKRLSVSPEIALRRETDGRIHSIPVQEYDTLYGY